MKIFATFFHHSPSPLPSSSNSVVVAVVVVGGGRRRRRRRSCSCTCCSSSSFTFVIPVYYFTYGMARCYFGSRFQYCYSDPFLLFLCLGKPSQISIKKPQPFEPTHFKVTCDVSPNVSSVDNVTYIALHRHLPSRNAALEPIAFVNVTENGGGAQACGNFTQNHVRISGRIDESDPFNSKLEAEFDPGSCGDAGEYTCTLVYSETGSDEHRLAMTQETLDNACGK